VPGEVIPEGLDESSPPPGQHNGKEYVPGEVVPEGLDESSPVRSAGLGVEGQVRPGRDDRLAGCAREAV
jgi:hypothetical protein